MNEPTETPAAQHRFVCKVCGAEAGVVRLFGTAAGAGGEIVRDSFTSRLAARVGAEAFEGARGAIEGGDIERLYDFDREVASFYCPPCRACYCGTHWTRWDVFDEEEDGFTWHDSIRGRCPEGHERMLED